MIQKHIGVISNLGTTIVVVMPFLPDEPDQALIVEVEALPPKYAESFSHLVRTEGQTSSETLYNLLARRRFGTGEIVINALHEHGFLRKIAIDQITLNINLPGQQARTMQLKELVSALRATNTEAIIGESQKVDAPSLVTQEAKGLDASAEARNLLMQAQLLEADASNLTRQAYILDETLKPKPRKRAAAKPKAKPKAKVKVADK